MTRWGRTRRRLRRIAELEVELNLGPPWWGLEPGTTDYGERYFYMPFEERRFRKLCKR